MCSIVASFDTEKLKELIELNSYRGSYSHSVSYYNVALRNFTEMTKYFGAPNLSDINIPEGHYGIVHVQAPTTQQTDSSSIHPSMINTSLLWHNGILKPSTISYLQRLFTMPTVAWDTKLLHMKLLSANPMPDEIDGSFSCLWYDHLIEKLFLFRNQISPMFVDEKLNISSTRFAGSEPTQADTFLEMDLVNQQLIPAFSFKTVNNPYFFG